MSEPPKILTRAVKKLNRRGKRVLLSKAERIRLREEKLKPADQRHAPALARITELLKLLGPPGDQVIQRCANIKAPGARLKALVRGAKEIKREIDDQIRYKEKPVDIRTFVTSPDYLDLPIKPHIDEDGAIYPAVMEELEKICAKDHIEVVLTGGIGSAKTTVALILLAFHLYLISVLRDPHKEFGLIKNDEIVLVFQSLNASHAKTVDYGRFKAMIQNSPYFQKNFMFNKQIDSELQFPNRITVRPVSGSSTAAIGQNVMSGILDEVNFMKVTEKSKNSRDAGTYDQAWENYTSIVRRRESRFMKKGRIPGILCLVSSKRYPGEFTDVKIEEAKKNPRIYIYDKRVWEIAPPGKFTGEFFRIFIGDLARKPRVLAPDEFVTPEDKHLVMLIPVEYRSSFDSDMLGSLRDIAGVSTLALQPFIIEIEKARACFGVIDTILSRDDCDFKYSKISILPRRFQRQDCPRFVHVDLSINGDCAGVGCGYVPGFTQMMRDEQEEPEILPVVCFDFLLEVRPPPNEEIQFHKIRSLLRQLRDMGLPIRWVTYDLFQSVDSLQMLHRNGFICGVQSMDKTTTPYDITKVAMMDGRLHAPMHEKGYKEIISLERDVKRNKIDHPAHSSKDVSDCIAGVTFGLTMRREIWVKHGIPLHSIPYHLRAKANTSKNSIDGRGEEANA